MMEKMHVCGERGCYRGAKRARAGPTYTDKQEMSTIDFVKEHPELYTKENACYVFCIFISFLLFLCNIDMQAYKLCL